MIYTISIQYLENMSMTAKEEERIKIVTYYQKKKYDNSNNATTA